MLQRISDKLLIDAYVKAVTLEIDSDFIDLLKNEISRRFPT
ncbi:sporulation histidine kinase inhibitor Sda [Bacillus sp. J33]|nr:sporulation histidine kinase inhibitor Sda [Bacillus sp. J33]